jgi:ubiquinone/menaquinone biosynthesis C-methylase UbiE
MVDIYGLNFMNKTVLEVGTGRGGTTLELAKAMKNYKGAKLISTDIYDKNFKKIKEELLEYNTDAIFVKTDACKLEGIEENSIDFIVCNYTLCAINSKSGCETIALNRFRQVLKPGGMLYIEEEYPINTAVNSMQQIWSRKWQLLRAANTLLGELSFNEIAPENLKKILNILRFKEVQYKNEVSQITGEDCLSFFVYRFSMALDKLNNSELVGGLRKEGQILKDDAKRAGGMEIPVYKITAVK